MSLQSPAILIEVFVVFLSLATDLDIQKPIIKTDLKEIIYGDTKLIEMAKDGIQSRFFMEKINSGNSNNSRKFFFFVDAVYPLIRLMNFISLTLHSGFVVLKMPGGILSNIAL